MKILKLLRRLAQRMAYATALAYASWAAALWAGNSWCAKVVIYGLNLPIAVIGDFMPRYLSGVSFFSHWKVSFGDELDNENHYMRGAIACYFVLFCAMDLGLYLRRRKKARGMVEDSGGARDESKEGADQP